MVSKKHLFMIFAFTLQIPSAALLGYAHHTGSANAAEMLERETFYRTERPVISHGTRVFNVDNMDKDGDGILSQSEIGEDLFAIYDGDGNGMIDNIEYRQRPLLTVIPYEKEVVETHDYDADGIIDERTVTRQAFVEDTPLTVYDRDKSGLLPSEFTGLSFPELDVDGDRLVSLDEWKGSYVASIDDKNRREARYNDLPQ